MKVAILVVTLIALSSASPTLKEQWSSFKAQYGKSYDSEKEEQYRLSIFSDNLNKIEEHNSKHKAGLVSYYLKLNKFSDLTTEEYGALLGEFNKPGQQIHQEARLPFLPPENGKIPKSIDWRTKGAVTPVKDQGLVCRSGWAFSTTGSLEGQLFKKTGKLVSLSEQQLIDCSVDFGNRGCEGGFMNRSFSYLTYSHGIMSEDSYPYKGEDGTCKFQLKNAVSGSAFKEFAELMPGEGAVKTLEYSVASVGPISIGLSAGSDGFRHYGGGVFDGKDCIRTRINHAALLVGYGSESGQDYWIIKNSWGTKWGEEGYMRLEKNNYKNICGIASLASYPEL